MKKILIVCKGHPHVAGAQLYLKQISALFPRQAFELCFALRPEDGLQFIDEISAQCITSTIAYDWRHLSFLKAFRMGVRLFRETKPDLIIFNSPEDRILAPVWAAWFSKVPKTILVVHWAQSRNDMPLFSRKRMLPFPIPSRFAFKTRLIRALSYRLLDALLFVSHGTRQAYTELYKVPETRCHTIHNGVHVARFDQPQLRDGVRSQLGLAPDDCMLLATGNLTEVKGHRYLVAAVQKLVSRGSNVKCFIAGRGELEEALQAQIKKCGLEHHVFLLGYRSDIPALLSAADIFCMPSLNEAFGYSLVEAMAAGLPVVASCVGGIPEVVGDGREGFLMPAADIEGLAAAIDRLRQQAELRKKMGEAGFLKANQRFDLAIMLRQTQKLFNLLLQNPDDKLSSVDISPPPNRSITGAT